MPRTDLYLKVELDIDERESPERLAAEICRQIRKIYGVRAAEVSIGCPVAQVILSPAIMALFNVARA